MRSSFLCYIIKTFLFDHLESKMSQNNNMYNQTGAYNDYSNPYVEPAPYTSMETSYKPAEDDTLKHLSDGLLGQARKQFIMKVYIILTSTKSIIFSSTYDNSRHVFHILLCSTIPWVSSQQPVVDVGTLGSDHCGWNLYFLLACWKEISY